MLFREMTHYRRTYPRHADFAKLVPVSRVVVFDNSDLAVPYRLLGVFENGAAVELARPLPKRFRDLHRRQ